MRNVSFDILPDRLQVYRPVGHVRCDEPGVTIGVLLFGPHTDLAKRCLESLWPLAASPALREVRIWTNAVCPATIGYLEERLAQYGHKAAVLNHQGPNYLKYPALRAMLYRRPVLSEWFLWMDDDSFLKAADKVAWLEDVLAESKRVRADMVGKRYHLNGPLTARQCDWVESRPWYRGKPVRPPHRPEFLTGGWWMMKTALLYRHDWPPPDLRHRGGDVMLGQLCRQQDYFLHNYHPGIAINADAEGRDSRSPRRGYDEAPLGSDYRLVA